MKKLIFVFLFIFLQDKLLFATPWWTISGTLTDINGNYLHDYNIISFTVNSNTWPGYPFNQFYTYTGSGANGYSGLGFSNSTGQFAWNLTAFGVNYYPTNGYTTIQCIFNTTCGTVDTGVQIFSMPQGGALPQNLGTFSTSGSCLVVSPPGTLAVGQSGIPAQNGSGVDFSAVGGGNLGSLSPATSGTETMSLTQLGGFVGTTKVAAVFELGNCQNPPYNVTFFLPASSLAGLNGSIAVVHNSNFINPLTITYDSDGDAKIDFVTSSCSPFYVQGNSDQPLSVELTSFEAFANENSVNLIWKTASEKNSKGFELERNKKIIASYRTHSELVSAGESSGEKVYTFVDNEVEPNTNYTYGLFETDQNGTKTFLKDLKIKTKNSILPTEVRYNLKQNFPNPFNPATTIEFDLKEKSLVTLSVYNSKGELVQTLVNQELEAGNNFKAVWNGTNFSGKQVASGIYFYELRTENFSKTKKMILLK